jgi:hypothetical protein
MNYQSFAIPSAGWLHSSSNRASRHNYHWTEWEKLSKPDLNQILRALLSGPWKLSLLWQFCLGKGQALCEIPWSSSPGRNRRHLWHSPGPAQHRLWFCCVNVAHKLLHSPYLRSWRWSSLSLQPSWHMVRSLTYDGRINDGHKRLWQVIEWPIVLGCRI